MGDSLEDRLRSHERSFDGLLSLIPAKYYYGEGDPSEQWQRKKQTKEQARNAKRAKLDPDSSKSAKDVMEENARKRKRDEDEANEEPSDGAEGLDLDTETPGEGLKRRDTAEKKQKMSGGEEGTTHPAENPTTNGQSEEQKRERAEKRASKQERKKQKKAEKLERKKVKEGAEEEISKDQQERQEPDSVIDAPAAANDANEGINEKHETTGDMVPIEGFHLAQPQHPESTAPTSPSNSHTFDTSNAPSANSSVSSIIPPDAPGTTANMKQEKLPSPSKYPKPTPDELKQRLQKRLEELRTARHADGLDGKPARNRQELIEARRQRDEKRREHKKELRQKAKEEEQRLQDEAIARRFSPRGSLLASPGSPADSITSISNNFSFGRVMFPDGQQTDPNLTGFHEQKKQRGPQDPASALKAAESKKARIESYDDEKRAEIEDKDMWLNAKKRAHGERVKDDVSLLKKSLGRKEGAKKRSETQWKERLENVEKNKDMKQAKREENLRKRKEEKGKKGKGKGKSKGKARPGFEGSFKTKAGKKK